MAKKPVKITEVVLRDAHQSLLATRMTMDEMRPILPEMDKIPYFSVECWGGATFDSCIRFLDEDPWERLRILRKELPHQKLQMLFRGQNMLGYRPYADDAVEYFVQKSVANGIDVIRIFDALNDPRNLQTAIKAANKEGAHVQGCISYTLSPVHNNEYFAAYAKTLEEMGANSICIKDMAGLLTPYTCYDLVKKLKETVSIPVDIHSHYTAGLASMSILKGIEAGADIIDTAMSPLSLGTSHMPTESLVAALQGTDYDTGLDLKQLNVVRAYFAKLREKYIANGQINPKSLGVDANTLLYQVPGGMFSNMLKQLKDAGIIKYKGLFELYCSVSHAKTKIDPGTYELSTNYDYRALVKKMQIGSGAMVTTKVTIPEGYTMEQIFHKLEDENVCSYDDLMDAAANYSYNYSFIDQSMQGDAKRLEGFLFPDTYEFYQGMQASSAINKFLENFHDRITAEMLEKADERGMTMQEVVTVASMIEKEAANDDERAMIAAVIYNRIAAGMPLQIDSTIMYVLPEHKDVLTVEDTKIDSPYNTYQNKGLPPTPIANPGLASIKATLSPASTQALYYALDAESGTHKFFTSYGEFQAFVAKQSYSQ